MKYYLIVGEASGDLHASNLMRALRQRDARAYFRFYGGDKMKAVGGTMVKNYGELAYMGFIPVLTHLGTILRNMRRCKQDIVAWHPDVVILVDYPGFNLGIAQFVHSHTSIPVFYYIAPKIWAWKEGRIKRIRRDVDELFSILPFEVPFFEQKYHYPIHYVGNPCVDAIEAFMQSEEAPKETDPKPNIIAILPGSRKQEIRDNLGIMLRAARYGGGYNYVIAGAPNIEEKFYERFVPKGMNVRVEKENTYRILSRSVAALVTSGTATLETALLRVPQVVCYHLPFGRAYKWLRKRLIKVPYISLVNLVAGREIVTELVADDMTVTKVANELIEILPGGCRRKPMLLDYEEMIEKLGHSGASDRAAETMISILNKSKR